MNEVSCRCGFSPNLDLKPSFCSACGEPLPLTAAELAERSAELAEVHAAILACVLDLTSVEIARVEGEGAWTRIDPSGYSIVAWCRSCAPEAGVHGIETNPLRRGGFSVTSSADKQRGRRVTVNSLAELMTVLPSLFDD